MSFRIKAFLTFIGIATALVLVGVAVANSWIQVDSPVEGKVTISHAEVVDKLGLYSNPEATQPVPSIEIQGTMFYEPAEYVELEFNYPEAYLRNEYPGIVAMQAPCGLKIPLLPGTVTTQPGLGSFILGEAHAESLTLAQKEKTVSVNAGGNYYIATLGRLYVDFYSMEDGRWLGCGCSSQQVTLQPNEIVRAKFWAQIYYNSPNDIPDGEYLIGRIFSAKARPVAGTLTATHLEIPADLTVVPGTSQFPWTAFRLDASESSESIRVTVIGTGHSSNSPASDLMSARLLAIDEGNETQISGVASFLTEDLSFGINENFVVPEGEFIDVFLKADLSQDAQVGQTHIVSVTYVNATGVTTGQPISPTIEGTGQEITVAGPGTLTVTLDSSSLSPGLILAGAEGRTLTVFQFQASGEDIEVKTVELGINGFDSAIEKLQLWIGGTLIGTTFPGADATNKAVFRLSPGSIIPTDTTVTFTVKAYISDYLVVENGETIQITAEASGFKASGESSAQTIVGSAPEGSEEGYLDGAVYTIYSAYPEFRLNLESPSGTLVPSASTTLAIIDVTNNVDQFDISFRHDQGNQLLFTPKGGGWGDAEEDTETIVLMDENRTILDTLQQDIMDPMQFDFSENPLLIAGGATKTIYVIGDTTDFTESAAIHLSLDSVGWSVNEAGNYHDCVGCPMATGRLVKR